MEKEWKLRGLGYYGGKSQLGRLNKWINGLLGFDSTLTYIEPFAGMLGILLSRPPAKTEIVNDANGDLVNWWLSIRDFPKEMAHKIALTPWSRTVFESSIDLIRSDKGLPIDRALAFHVLIKQSINKACNTSKGAWSVSYGDGKSIVTNNAIWPDHAFEMLATRLRRVQIECRDGLDILERVARKEESLTYLDPPYRDAATMVYGKKFSAIDKNRALEILRQCKGKIAISGYGDDWDETGFIRHEKETITRSASTQSTKGLSRCEVLWINFTPCDNTQEHLKI